jgi:hypothetical protein
LTQRPTYAKVVYSEEIQAYILVWFIQMIDSESLCFTIHSKILSTDDKTKSDSAHSELKIPKVQVLHSRVFEDFHIVFALLTTQERSFIYNCYADLLMYSTKIPSNQSDASALSSRLNVRLKPFDVLSTHSAFLTDKYRSPVHFKVLAKGLKPICIVGYLYSPQLCFNLPIIIPINSGRLDVDSLDNLIIAPLSDGDSSSSVNDNDHLSNDSSVPDSYILQEYLSSCGWELILQSIDILRYSKLDPRLQPSFIFHEFDNLVNCFMIKDLADSLDETSNEESDG